MVFGPYTYQNSNYTEEEILNAMRNGHINLKNCWKVTESDVYRQIRPGLIKERSPTEVRDPMIKKTDHDK